MFFLGVCETKLFTWSLDAQYAKFDIPASACLVVELCRPFFSCDISRTAVYEVCSLSVGILSTAVWKDEHFGFLFKKREL